MPAAHHTSCWLVPTHLCHLHLLPLMHAATAQPLVKPPPTPIYTHHTPPPDQPPHTTHTTHTTVAAANIQRGTSSHLPTPPHSTLPPPGQPNHRNHAAVRCCSNPASCCCTAAHMQLPAAVQLPTCSCRLLLRGSPAAAVQLQFSCLQPPTPTCQLLPCS